MKLSRFSLFVCAALLCIACGSKDDAPSPPGLPTSSTSPTPTPSAARTPGVTDQAPSTPVAEPGADSPSTLDPSAEEALPSAPAEVAGPKSTLRFRFVAGQTYSATSQQHFTLRFDVSGVTGQAATAIQAVLAQMGNPSSGSADISTRTLLSVKTVSASGNAEVEANVQGGDMTFAIGSERLNQPVPAQGQAATMNFSSRGVSPTVGSSGDPDVDAMVQRIMSFASAFQLPEEEVGVGSTWQQNRNEPIRFSKSGASLNANVQVRSTNQVLRFEGEGDAAHAVIQNDVRIVVQNAEIRSPQGNFDVSLRCQQRGTFSPRLVNAALFESEGRLTCHLEASSEVFGRVTADLSGNNTQTQSAGGQAAAGASGRRRARRSRPRP